MMRRFWKRGSGLDVERELRALRPQPREELTRSIVGRLEAPRRRSAALRTAFAVGLSAVMLAALVGTGGVGYAAEPAKRAATAVKKVFVPKGVVVAKKSAAVDQYIKPKPKVKGKVKAKAKTKKKKKLRGVVARAKPRFTG